MVKQLASNVFSRRLAQCLGAAAVLMAGAGPASAQFFGGHYDQQTGEAIFTGVCQGCHMPDARGAIGAGAYPALANNPKLVSSAYPVLVIINGQKAMPSFGESFTDAQIAEVVNYVRSHFGNHYADKLTPEAVKALRPAKPAP